MSCTIEKIATHIVATKLADPIVHPYLGQRTRVVTMVVQVKTNDGCSGLGWVFGENVQQMASVAKIVQGLESFLKGGDPLRRELLYDKMWGLTVDLLHEGAATMALSAIDTALWDICGKKAGLPIWRLLGGTRDKVPAYMSTTLWRHMEIPELESAAAKILEKGFKAMKLRLGARPIEEDVARAAALRKFVGSDVAIMTDALWGFLPADAIKLARRLVEFDLYWLEEPVRDGDLKGLARVRDVELMPIAGGERLSTPAHIGQLLPAIDHAILDVQHIGGVTPWLKAAAMVDSANLPISSHGAQEIQVHLLGGIRTGAWIEYLDWWDDLFDVPLQPKNGILHLNEQPGFGVDIPDRTFARLAVDE